MISSEITFVFTYCLDDKNILERDRVGSNIYDIRSVRIFISGQDVGDIKWGFDT